MLALKARPRQRDRRAGIGFDQRAGARDRHGRSCRRSLRARCGSAGCSSGAPWTRNHGIDRDAMPADAGAGLEDVDARVAVGEADHFPHVDPHRVGDHRQFVGKGDVDVAEGVFGQLGHLRRARGRW